MTSDANESRSDRETVERMLENLREAKSRTEGNSCSVCRPPIRRRDLERRPASSFDEQHTGAGFLHVCRTCGRLLSTAEYRNAV